MAPADASFPGANGKIAFERCCPTDIWTMNPDGTGQVNLTNTSAAESDPNWSPDGSKILFTKVERRGDVLQNVLYVMNADGSGVTTLGDGYIDAVWSPDGTKIAFTPEGLTIRARTADNSTHWLVGRAEQVDFTNREPDWSPDDEQIVWEVLCDPPFSNDLNAYIVIAPAQGGGPVERVTSPDPCPSPFTILPYSDLYPSWSPDAQRILFTRTNLAGADNPGPDPTGLYSIRPDGTGKILITTESSIPAVWSPDGARIAYQSGPNAIGVMNADGTGRTNIATGKNPDWQPIPINAYPRPKGASPMQVSLVPAYEPCAAPDTTHGAPLAFPSCNPPDQASAHLTTGTPDANGRAVRMNASLSLRVVTGDVLIGARLNDVANTDLTDYTGTLRAQLPVRITDKFNTPHPGGPGAATTQPFVYGFTIPCASDPAPTTGSACNVATSMNALAPGTHVDGRRAVWQLGQVRVFDGGSDQDGSTIADNTVFAVEGVFVP